MSEFHFILRLNNVPLYVYSLSPFAGVWTQGGERVEVSVSCRLRTLEAFSKAEFQWRKDTVESAGILCLEEQLTEQTRDASF